MNTFRRKMISYFIRSLKYYQYFHQKVILLIKKKNEPKIFCIGDVKTGTSSIYKALNILGYRTVRLFDIHVFYNKGHEEYLKRIKNSKYDAFADDPIGKNDLFKKIYKIYPNSKFIFTIRKNESFQKSYMNYFGWTLESNLEQIKKRVKMFDDHNKKVISFFKDKKSQLLIMNVTEGDGWEKLCKFLDKPIPNRPFPHENKGKYKSRSIK